MSDMTLEQLRRKYARVLSDARDAYPSTVRIRGNHATLLRIMAWRSINAEVSWRIAYHVTHDIKVPQNDINIWRAIERHLDRLQIQNDRIRGRIPS